MNRCYDKITGRFDLCEQIMLGDDEKKYELDAGDGEGMARRRRQSGSHIRIFAPA